MSMRPLALLLVLAALAAPSFGDSPRLLVDANPVPPAADSLPPYRAPSRFAALADGRAVFFVESPGSSHSAPLTPGPLFALWATDGTPEGTELLAGFCADDVAPCWDRPRFLGRLGDAVLFEVPRLPGEAYPLELWRTDGTREGTFLLQRALCRPSFPSGATEAVAGGFLYFGAADGEAGCEVWRSDGTAAGTMRVADVEPGAESSSPTDFAALGGRVFFNARGVERRGLWVVDGRGASPVRGDLPFVELTTAVAGRLFFVAPEPGADASALWTSDGTAAGTRRVRRFAVYQYCDYPPHGGECYAVTTYLQPDGAGVLFVADDGGGRQLWRSDGTPGGTQALTAPNVSLGEGQAVRLPAALLLPIPGDRPGSARLWAAAGGRPAQLVRGLELRSPLRLLPDGRRAVFAGWRGEPQGTELWVTDGTAAGTRQLRDLCPGRCSSTPSNLLALGDAVYFTAADRDGPGLWRTDGTAAGTVLLGRATFPAAGPPGGIALGDRTVLGLQAGLRVSGLWATDRGRSAGLVPLKVFARAASGSDPRFLSLGDRVLFTTSAGADMALWSSDGASTRRLTTVSQVAGEGFNVFSRPVRDGGRAFLFAGSPADRALFHPRLVVTDGTPEGTRTVADLGNVLLHSASALGGRLYFVIDENEARSLWVSNGTAAGTARLFALPAFTAELTTVGDALYFFGSVRDGVSLFRTDGTAAGTSAFGNYGRPGFDPEVAAVGDRVFFAADGQLYRRDGSPTEPIFPGGEVMGLKALGDRLLFFGQAAGDDGPRRGLWSTDGTAAGTVFLAAVSAQPPGLELGTYGVPTWPRAGGRLLFRGWDPEHGFELWSTDGTAAGTVRIEIAPGSASSFPDDFAEAGGRVWFTADDPAHGREIWVSDGTPAGTHQALELAPGMFSALPARLTPAGGNLFFSAYTPAQGREPWVLPLVGVP